MHEAIKFTQQGIEVRCWGTLCSVMCARALAVLQDSRARGLPELRLIVGKGHHSLSRIAKIKPAVSLYMQRKQLIAKKD